MNAPYTWFFEVFWGILEKTQSYRPHPHLELWGFLRLIFQKPQTYYAILSLKNPRNIWNFYPQPQKNSNFEAETEDPRILRSQLATLVQSKTRLKTGLAFYYQNSCNWYSYPTMFSDEPSISLLLHYSIKQKWRYHLF